jgi:hypothetical protein
MQTISTALQFRPLAYSVLADQIYCVIETHGYANAQILASYLTRPIGTIRNTLTAMTEVGRLVLLQAGGHAPAYALRLPSRRNPNIRHELGIVAGDLALALCEERGYGEVLPISEGTKEAFLHLPVLKRPDRMWRWKRPGDQVGMELLREYQRSSLGRREFRAKLQPYFELPPQAKRLLIETATKKDAAQYLAHLRTFTADPLWLKQVYVTCQEEYLHDFVRYVQDIWTNLDGKKIRLAKE